MFYTVRIEGGTREVLLSKYEFFWLLLLLSIICVRGVYNMKTTLKGKIYALKWNIF